MLWGGRISTRPPTPVRQIKKESSRKSLPGLRCMYRRITSCSTPLSRRYRAPQHNPPLITAAAPPLTNAPDIAYYIALSTHTYIHCLTPFVDWYTHRSVLNTSVDDNVCELLEILRSVILRLFETQLNFNC